MSKDKHEMTSEGLNYLDRIFGLDFLVELREKYPNIDIDKEQNQNFWNEIAQKRGFKNHKEWIESENNNE